ncbi:MFS transporter [Schnuerera ultunensis]|uniref:Putative Major facilitator superfamily MFS_1 n=1 Tax=[Clostridium] ultunense Esp TaxID=1288971 RepID=A0A1M4PQJ8_9FIRM|nr:MFS transporter [Schnuerera ultunensis]SHD77764.1 putative Major facilitator superfamily MFS_1 [[Clostridium] ultunense Esp]
MNTKLIKQKDFFLLILGKLVSLLGSNMQQFALSLYVLSLTGSATIFASILSISILPRLLLSPIAGVFGDWFDRKRTIVLLDLLNFIIIGIYAVIFTINGSLTLPMIYILVILLEITEIFFGSAMSAVIPSMVEKEDLLDANSFNSLVMNLGQLLAPVLGAIIYGSFGLKIVMTINSLSFLLSAISEMFINIPKKHKKPEEISAKAFKMDLIEGINIIKGNKFISTMIYLGTIINFILAPIFSVGLVFIIKEVLKATDFQFGIFQMVLSASMIAAPIFASGYIKKVKVGKLCYTSFVSIALSILVMAVIPSKVILGSFKSNLVPYILLSIISFMVGVFATTANIAMGTIFNQVTPIELMGRTSTVFNLAVTVFIPIGQMIFGYLYDIISPSYVIAISGLILIFTVKRYKIALMELDEQEDGIRGDAINEI